MRPQLLTTKNTKIIKNLSKNYMTFGLHLLPGNVCPRASVGCLKACLNTSGHGRYRITQEARAKKTKYFLEEPLAFLGQLKCEIGSAINRASKKGLEAVFRLNLTSDIPWEIYEIPQAFPDSTFYDYTKFHDRCPPKNYHLTFSRSESLQNHIHAKEWIKRGGNVAVVFKDNFPQKFWGLPVHSGEADDLRFLDPMPAIIGLKAKAKAKLDTTGFVVT